MRAGPAPMSLHDWLLLATLSLLWGGSFFCIGVAVREWPPLTIVLARVGLAAMALWAAVAVSGLAVRRDRSALAAVLGMGLLNNALPFVLIVWAQQSLPSGVAAILNAATPLWAVLVSHAAGVERLTAARLAGAAVGFAGVAAMVRGDLAAGLPLLAAAAVACASFSYALSNLWGSRMRTLGIAPVVAAAGQCSVATVLLLPFAFIVEDPLALPAPSWATLAAVLTLALACTALAYLLFFRLLGSAGPVNVTLVTLLVPVSAVLLGTLLLDETLSWRHAIGMAAIAAGLALIDGRPMAALRARWATRG